MNSTRAEASYTAALHRNSLFASMGLRDAVPGKVLHPDEEVLLVLPGVAGDFPNVVIVTVSRVILAKVAGAFVRAKTRRWVESARITGVEYRPAVFSRVKISVRGGRAIRMMPNRKEDATRFRDEFDHLLRTGHLPR